MSASSPAIDASRALVAPHALLPGGFARDVLIAWDAEGTLKTVQADPPHESARDLPRACGLVVPGLPNLHSHAFQRVFAGLAETRAEGDEGFWSWREAMYRVAGAITPQAMEDVATQVYVEMLATGYTSVCEFHYLHRDSQGRAYADPAEMSWRLVSAAERAGIGLTLLPVLYQASGFGGQALAPAQRRFMLTVDALMRLVERVQATGTRVGLAPHSLRAVSPPALREAVQAMHGIDPLAPVHIHVAEQQREVDECVAWSGERPVQWLLSHAAVDARWCLVHATHVDDAELAAMASCGAVVGLCPTTEANLGDGIFPAARFIEYGGTWGIGSDSHVQTDPAAELCLLEYGQRLALQRRNVLASHEHSSVAERLWLGAVAGGARASARRIAGIEVGQRADFVVLADDGVMAGLSPSHVLAGHVFAHRAPRSVRETWVGGRCRVREGVHPLADEACRRFVATRGALLQKV